MNETPRKILIIRLSSLGDVLLTSSALSSIHQFWPDCEIHFLTKKPTIPLIQFHPAVSKIWQYPAGKNELNQLKADLKKENFDLVADWQGNFRSLPFRKLGKESVSFPKHRFKRWLYIKFKRAFNPGPVPERYLQTLNDFQVPDSGAGLSLIIPKTIEIDTEKRFLQWRGSEKSPIYFIAAGAKHATKRYPVSFFIDIMNMLAEMQPSARFILLGGPDELDTANQIKKSFPDNQRVWNAAGGFSLLESAEIIRLCTAGFSNDSFLMHVATAMQIPVVAFFGSTTPALGFAPFRSPSLIVEDKSLACRPCSHIGRDSCPLQHFNCMNNLQPEIWFPVIYQFLLSSSELK